MLDEPNPRAAPGGNNPPDPTPYRADIVEAHKTKASEFLDAAGDWLDLKEITSEEQAGQLVDYLSGVKARIKATDDDRKADKKPHDDAGKAVQAIYTPILDKLKLAVDRVTPMQSAWLRKLEDERRAEAARRQEEAKRVADEAEKLAAAAAARNDLSGESDAEAAQKAAAAAQKDADRFAKGKTQVRSGSGGGRTQSLRTYVYVALKNPRVAFMEFQDDPALHECLTQLAQQRARSAAFNAKTDTIPGFDIRTERK